MTIAHHLDIPYQGDRFCRTFTARVLAEQGIPLPMVERPEDARDWARVDRPERWDVVVFNRAGQPAHVGTCLGRGRFLHVDVGQRSRVERLDSMLWRGSVEGFYRYTPESHA